MKKIIFAFFGFLVLFTVGVYFSKQDVKAHVNCYLYKDLRVETDGIPKKNNQILQFVQNFGSSIAPTYQSSVCTEYLIEVLTPHCRLNNQLKNTLRIITEKDLDSLLEVNSPVTKGVFTALTESNQATPILDLEDAKAGDIVQFWDQFTGKTYGHCGILRAIDIDKGIMSLYSSSPKTDGHGQQLYPITEHLFIARLK